MIWLKRIDRKHFAIGCTIAAAIMAPAIHAVAQSGSTSAPATDWAAAAARLAEQVRGEIRRLAPTASVEDFEAAILFLADQSGEPAQVVCSAFEQVKLDSTTPQNARYAMDNVCRNITKRRGTGAIPGGAGFFGTPGFSSPVIVTGGGSSNYSPAQ